jgi:hypothetical protein
VVPGATFQVVPIQGANEVTRATSLLEQGMATLSGSHTKECNKLKNSKSDTLSFISYCEAITQQHNKT